MKPRILLVIIAVSLVSCATRPPDPFDAALSASMIQMLTPPAAEVQP